MTKDKKNKVIIFIVLGVIAMLFLFQAKGPSGASTQNPIQNVLDKITSLGGGGSSTQTKSAIVNQGVGMKALLVDETGNIQKELISEKQQTFAIISSPTPSGYLSISPYSCTSSNTACTTSTQCPSGQTCINSLCKCSFLAISSALDNSAGDSDVTITGVTSTTACSSGNTATGCSTISNVLGDASIANTKRGNYNSIYSALMPMSLTKGSVSSAQVSEGMSLGEVAFGLVDFTVSASGTFKDAFGNDVPLTGKFGTLTMRITPSTCSDGTPVDPDLSDNDESRYCSTVNVGKYCRVGSAGQATLTNRASLCGCPAGQYAEGQICKITSCTPNQCILGTVNYCLADGRSYETRCNQCGYSNCPNDANGQLAIGCDPTSGEPSQCKYPLYEAAGFLVNIDPINIPTIAACGDGIKSGGEQCDKFDFGGESCTSVGAFSGGSLACNADCSYNTAGCLTNFVKFRSLFTILSGSSNADEIAFRNIGSVCDSSVLTKAGEYSSGGKYSATGDCFGEYEPGYTQVMNVPIITGITRSGITGSLNAKLWRKDADTSIFVICADKTGGGYVSMGFKTTNPANTISNSANQVNPTLEILC